MRRRDLIKSAALVSAGAVAGLGGLLPLSRWAAAAPPSKIGAWSSVVTWPLIPIHAVLLGDGRVLTYGTSSSGQMGGYFIYDVWDPKDGFHLTLPNNTKTDIFCSAQLILPQNGNVLLAGGDNWTGTNSTNTGITNSSIFNPIDNSLTLSNNMQRARWYATTTTLSDGRIYIQGGWGNGPNDPQDGKQRPEIREADGTFRLLEGVNTSSLFAMYPRNWVAPTGEVFGFSNLSMYYVNPNANGGNGSITPFWTMPSDGPSGWTSTDVMYAPGKILRCGGGSTEIPEQGGKQTIAKNAAAVIDINVNGGTPIYKKQPSMPIQLHWANATVLADGNVVVTGGSTVTNDYNTRNTTALLWKADTGGWTQGAQSASHISRLYHSIALLMPDGSVLSGGGGASAAQLDPNDPRANLNVEFYYPPYLYDNSGKLASRPTITSCPDSIGYNGKFDVVVSSAAKRVTFIKTGSVTHSFNFEQRFMELSFTTTSPGTLSVQAPSSAFLAPPGNYLLFVIDSLGVPSVAKIVRIS